MTLINAIMNSPFKYAWAEWDGGRVYVGKWRAEDPYVTWEVRLHYTDGRRGGVWPTIAGLDAIPALLAKHLGLTVLNCPEWRSYEPGEYLHPDNNPSVIGFR